MPIKNLLAQAKYMKEYRAKRGEELLALKRRYWVNLRLKVLSHYSKGTLHCACCQEFTYEFLSIDHINGGGNQHRKKLGSKYIYSWLIQNNYPTGYQVLCHNCNMAKAFYKQCPHQTWRNEIKSILQNKQFNNGLSEVK